MINQMQIPIEGESAAAEARREATALALTLGFDETAKGKVAIVVTEIATNIAKHAKRGQLLLRALERNGVAVIEVLGLDQGPGMANVGDCLRDGYSTAGSPGTGLGAMTRLADEFDIYSAEGKGTALVARLWSRQLPAVNRLNSLEIGVVCLAKPGEVACGDAWAIECYTNHCLIVVVDGLGHGSDAALASMEALKTLQRHSTAAPAELIEFAHGALRSTRGAAMAVARLGPDKEVRFAGIGNISGVILAPLSNRHMVSHNGIVGHEVRRIQEFFYPWSRDSLLLMHSDGIATHWNLDHYPGLINRHPSLIAGVLSRDFARGRDDLTVLVIKPQ